MNDIIPQETATSFSAMTMHLINITDYMEFRQATDNIITRWPGCKVWLEWWIFHRSAKKLFRALSKMPEENFEKLPATTNGQEAMHHFFYLTAGRDQNILTGELTLKSLCLSNIDIYSLN